MMAWFGFGRKKNNSCCGAVSPCDTGETPLDMDGEAKGGITDIQVLGAGCPTCHKQYEIVKAAVRQLGLSVNVEYSDDMQTIAEYGVMRLPALVINGTVAAMGRVLDAADVEALLRTYADGRKSAGL